MRVIFVAIVLYTTPVFALELNDGHIHYNRDVWSDLSPTQALKILSDNGIQRAIVSSTPTEGTEKLYHAAPQRIIPFLRPYREYRDRATWNEDPAMVDYIKHHLASGIYKGFGEFHVFVEHSDTPVMREIMRIAAEKNLTLSAHTDAETIQVLFKMQPTLRIIWAHCGFDHPVQDVKRLLDQYASLYCELSFRNGITTADGKVTAAWKAMLEGYAKRFMIGMDTYIPSQWANLGENADYAQSWLRQIAPDAAELIANGNIARLFASR